MFTHRASCDTMLHCYPSGEAWQIPYHSARIDADLDSNFSGWPRDRAPLSWLISDALRSYVANEQQFLAAVQEGKQALRDGKTHQELSSLSGSSARIHDDPVNTSRE